MRWMRFAVSLLIGLTLYSCADPIPQTTTQPFGRTSRCGDGVCDLGESGQNTCSVDCRGEWTYLPPAYESYGPDSLFPDGVEAMASDLFEPGEVAIQKRQRARVTVE